MSDLVDRLRDFNKSEAVRIEAADRIEQLERVLAQARECLTSTAYFSEQMAPDVIAAIDEAMK